MIELQAKEGYLLTNGETYSDHVYLSDLDSPENWTEITEEEAQERQMEAEMENGMERPF